MPRPRRQDRASIATDTLTIRLSNSERRGLDELVKRLRGEGGNVTAATVVRALINAELLRSGILTVGTPPGGTELPPSDPEEHQRVLAKLQAMQPLIDEYRSLLDEFGDTLKKDAGDER